MSAPPLTKQPYPLPEFPTCKARPFLSSACQNHLDETLGRAQSQECGTCLHPSLQPAMAHHASRKELPWHPVSEHRAKNRWSPPRPGRDSRTIRSGSSEPSPGRQEKMRSRHCQNLGRRQSEKMQRTQSTCHQDQFQSPHVPHLSRQPALAWPWPVDQLLTDLAPPGPPRPRTPSAGRRSPESDGQPKPWRLNQGRGGSDSLSRGGCSLGLSSPGPAGRATAQDALGAQALQACSHHPRSSGPRCWRHRRQDSAAL